jgi:hypothetical protein
MTMRIVRERPPNFEAIAKVFPEAYSPTVIFCWGDTICNPFWVPLTKALVAHEEVHCGQQGGDPAGWWQDYLSDAEFRLAQELPAHAAEYRVASFGLARPARRFYLKDISEKLSAPLYGRIISTEEAKKRIRELSRI